MLWSPDLVLFFSEHCETIPSLQGCPGRQLKLLGVKRFVPVLDERLQSAASQICADSWLGGSCPGRAGGAEPVSLGSTHSEQTQEFPYVRVALAHGLPQVGVDTAGVGVLNFCLGPHFWGGNVLHTHVHKACNRTLGEDRVNQCRGKKWTP